MDGLEVRGTPPIFTLSPSFSGHETFTFRYPWLKKGFDGFNRNPQIFHTEDAIVELGVGKNMVSSIRHWMLATGVVEEGELQLADRRRTLVLSAFGQHLLRDKGWDPFLEDDATLWLLHWHLVTNQDRATTWFYAFHILREAEFTRTSLLEQIARFIKDNHWPRVSQKTLENDIACFIRTYLSVKRGVTSTIEDTLDCPLTNLGILQADEKAEYFRFNTRSKSSLPTAVFAYALTRFWDRYKTTQNTISIREIARGYGSPGRAFRLDEDAVLNHLKTIGETTNGAFRLDNTGLIRQVIRDKRINANTILSNHYPNND